MLGAQVAIAFEDTLIRDRPASIGENRAKRVRQVLDRGRGTRRHIPEPPFGKERAAALAVALLGAGPCRPRRVIAELDLPPTAASLLCGSCVMWCPPGIAAVAIPPSPI